MRRATGRKRAKIAARPICASPATRLTAATSADACPTSLASYRCAATTQNAMPNAALPTVENISAKALRTSALPAIVRRLTGSTGASYDG